MPEKVATRERLYRRRLLLISPLSALIIFVLFVTSDVVPYKEIEQRLGWKGPLEVLPEITILPDDDPFETFTPTRKLRPLSSLDVHVLEEKAESEGPRKKREKLAKEEELDLSDRGKNLEQVIPLHTQVPYSEDYVILRMVHPRYPSEELMNGIEGEVTLEVLVNEQGEVENAWVISVIGPRSFEKSSLEAIKKFLFQPPIIDGKPSPMSIRFQINFRIVS